MKKYVLTMGMISCVMVMLSCNDNTNQTGSGTGDSSANTANASPNDSMSTPTNLPPVSSTPVNKEDSMFIMEAAAGGMMEVEAGKVAQQNGSSQRIKDFGAMMVSEHGKGGQDLSSIAALHGITLPTSLPADMQKHVDQMKSMNGKSFDQHYISMMVNDHQKDLAKFKKAATSSSADDLKTWANNFVPVIQKHLDSIQAIKKGM